MTKNNFLLLFILSLYSASCSSQTYRISDHYNGTIFHMPDGETEPRSFFELMKWKFTGNDEKWPDKSEQEIMPTIPAQTVKDKMVVTFVNHATFLIQVDGINILTDPIWAKRASPFSFAGPKRAHEAGINFENLPNIDIVLISHNHYDHMDSETISKLQLKFAPKFIVPLANFEKMKSFGATNIIELDWWDPIVLSPDLKITLTPARHWSARSMWDKREALWGSFYIEAKKQKVYFAGDSGYGPHFTETFKKLGAPDLALLPIGAYEPRWFMKDAHMNPEEAILAHLDLQAKHSIGMHFGTFKLTDESIDTPLKDLQMAKEKLQIRNFTVLVPGTTYEL